MTNDELDQIRTEITHALANANRETAVTLKSINQAIERLDKRPSDPKPERLESIRGELEELESDSAGETRDYVRRAREHLRAFQENRGWLDEGREGDGTRSDGTRGDGTRSDDT